MAEKKILSANGNQMVAEAYRQAEPDVVCAYPITPLKGPLIHGVLAGELIKVHIGAFGEGGVPAELPSQLPQLVPVGVFQIGIGNDRVRQAGV